MKKARVTYNVSEDAFVIEINTGEGWVFESSYRCVAREGGDGVTSFISWTILDKLAQLRQYGYTITRFL